MNTQISNQELKVLLSHDFLRLLLYVMTGIIKSISLVSSLVVMTELGQITELKTFILLFIVGMMKLGSPAIVYYLDISLRKKRFEDHVIEESLKRLKHCALVVFVAIEACAYYNEEIKSTNYSRGRFIVAQDILFSKGFRGIHLISGSFMAGLYAFYSYEYGILLIEKLND